jgi:predicted permease
MFLQILEIVTPVFALCAVGYCWKRFGGPFDIPFVTRLVFVIAVPALIFSVLSRIEVDPRAFRDLALASLALYGLITLVAAPLIWASGLDRRAYLAPFVFGNTGNVGLPIALFAFGEQGLAYAMVVFAVMAGLSFTIGVAMVAGRGSPFEAFKQPIFYAAILGIVFAMNGWRLPDAAQATLELAGQMMIPMMLITLGVAIAQLDVRDFGRAVWISLAKATVCAGAAIAVLLWFDLPRVAAGALVIQAMTPVAVTNYLLAARYDADPNAVAGLVVVSTLAAIALMPLTLAALL